MKKSIIFVIMLVLSISLSGCTGNLIAADRLFASAQNPILFIDNFTTQTGGWRTHTDRLSFAGFDQEGFRLMVDHPNLMFWSTPGLNFRDIDVYTKAQKVSGPDDNLFGVICRYQDQHNFYAFMISSDGYYGIYRKEAGVLQLMGLDEMGFSEDILRGEESNQITAICRANLLALVVNDVKLLQVEDNAFSTGDIGLIVGNLTEPGTNILFDYVIVVRP